jgi:phosphatidylinositol alpha-1,6-mannosyltransferase
MRTLLFTLEYPPQVGGVANYYGNLASYWPIGEHLLILDNNRRELLKSHGFLAWWPTLFTLKRKIALSRIDYVLVGQILPLGTVVWLLFWFKPLKYAVFIHGMDFAYALKMRRKKWLSFCILRRADKIIAANSYVAEQIQLAYPRFSDKVAVINPGVPGNTPNISESETLSLKSKYNLSDKTVLFSIGRLVKRKGVDRVIQALSLMTPEQAAGIVYVVAGAGSQMEYLSRLVPSKLRDKVIFLGMISESEKWLWLSACDIFIMPSRDIEGDFEGFGIVYLEANLCGKPVIAGNSGGVRDAVIDNQTGLIADSESPADIKEKILALATNAAQRAELGKNGRARAISDFNWEKQAVKLVKIIKQ